MLADVGLMGVYHISNKPYQPQTYGPQNISQTISATGNDYISHIPADITENSVTVLVTVSCCVKILIQVTSKFIFATWMSNRFWSIEINITIPGLSESTMRKM